MNDLVGDLIAISLPGYCFIYLFGGRLLAPLVFSDFLIDIRQQQRLLAVFGLSGDLYLATLFSLAGSLLAGDNRKTSSTVNLVEGFATNALALNEQGAKFALKMFYQALQSPIPFERHLEIFHHNYHDEPYLQGRALNFLSEISDPDGEGFQVRAERLQNAIERLTS